ncbi:MAG: hypothetical protein ACTSVU_06175 [Promethearchaeota archaeon]
MPQGNELKTGVDIIHGVIGILALIFILAIFVKSPFFTKLLIALVILGFFYLISLLRKRKSNKTQIIGKESESDIHN